MRRRIRAGLVAVVLGALTAAGCAAGSSSRPADPPQMGIDTFSGYPTHWAR